MVYFILDYLFLDTFYAAMLDKQHKISETESISALKRKGVDQSTDWEHSFISDPLK